MLASLLSLTMGATAFAVASKSSYLRSTESGFKLRTFCFFISLFEMAVFKMHSQMLGVPLGPQASLGTYFGSSAELEPCSDEFIN